MVKELPQFLFLYPLTPIKTETSGLILEEKIGHRKLPRRYRTIEEANLDYKEIGKILTELNKEWNPKNYKIEFYTIIDEIEYNKQPNTT